MPRISLFTGAVPPHAHRQRRGLLSAGRNHRARIFRDWRWPTAPQRCPRADLLTRNTAGCSTLLATMPTLLMGGLMGPADSGCRLTRSICATARMRALGHAFCWSRRRRRMPPRTAPSIPRPVMTAALGQSGLVAGAGTMWKKTDVSSSQ